MSILEDVKETGLNLFEDAKAWGSGVVDDVKSAATKFAIDQAIDNMKDQYSFEGAFVTHDKLTPELEEQGWKLGIDGQPYNAQLAVDFAPGGKFYDPDAEYGGTAGKERMLAAQNAATTAGATTPTSPFLYQDLRQRTPSGTIYNPSMEAFENASLFDYQGPGGLAEYTYGQGLPMGYGTYGTPVDVPNPYFWGQFGEGYVEPGVADNAINLPPVTMPGDVPQIPARPAGGGGAGGSWGTGTGGRDLTYAETLADMGIDPLDAPRTTFPSPGAELVESPPSVLNVGIPDFLSDAWTGVKDFGSDLIGGLFADDDVVETAVAPSGVEVNQAMPEFLSQGWPAGTPAGTPAGGSGLIWVDTGNNPDVGNLYTDPADRQLANEILGGEAYAQAVYENSPAAQAVPGMADKNIAGFNLGRPETKAQREMMSNVPGMFKVEAPSIFTEPGGSPFEDLDGRNYVNSPFIGPSAKPFEEDGLYVQVGVGGPPDPNIRFTADRNTGEVVRVDTNKGTVAGTGQFMRGGFGL